MSETASEKAKRLVGMTIPEISSFSGVPERNLYNWHHTREQWFESVCLGAAAKKGHHAFTDYQRVIMEEAALVGRLIHLMISEGHSRDTIDDLAYGLIDRIGGFASSAGVNPVTFRKHSELLPGQFKNETILRFACSEDIKDESIKDALKCVKGNL